jgi:hypothetical protein
MNFKNKLMMKLKCKTLLFSLVFVTSSKYCNSQTYPDAGMWNTFSLEYELNSRLSAVLDEEFRLKENFSEINLFYTNLGMTYKLSRLFKLGLIYRNIQKYQIDRTISFRNRLMLDIIVKKKYDPWTFSFRTRFQGEVKDFYTSENGGIPEYYMRNKFEIKYDLQNRITPYVSAEFRYQIYERKTPETNGLYHRVRPAIGFDYKINKKNSFGAYYLIQREWNVNEPEELYIIGLQYTLTI